MGSYVARASSPRIRAIIVDLVQDPSGKESHSFVSRATHASPLQAERSELKRNRTAPWTLGSSAISSSRKVSLRSKLQDQFRLQIK